VFLVFCIFHIYVHKYYIKIKKWLLKNSMLTSPRGQYYLLGIVCTNSNPVEELITQRNVTQCAEKYLPFSGILDRVVRLKFTDVSKEHAASIFKVEEYAKKVARKSRRQTLLWLSKTFPHQRSLYIPFRCRLNAISSKWRCYLR
jgi:hypothetical protein